MVLCTKNFMKFPHYNVVEICSKTFKLIGQKRVIIQERFHVQVVNKFIKVKNFGSYWIHQNVDHSGSIKISRYDWKMCFKQ